MLPTFSNANVVDWLTAASAESLDGLPFGVVRMAQDGTVVAYNTAEADVAGLTPARVIGRHFFTSVAPCTNNYLVAQRFETECELDATIDYVFTLRMKPTPVRLRMLRRPDLHHMYLLVERR
jgi:photoactive yellow protein